MTAGEKPLSQEVEDSITGKTATLQNGYIIKGIQSLEAERDKLKEENKELRKQNIEGGKILQECNLESQRLADGKIRAESALREVEKIVVDMESNNFNVLNEFCFIYSQELRKALVKSCTKADVKGEGEKK